MKYLICLFKVIGYFFLTESGFSGPSHTLCLLFSMFLYVRIKTKGRGRETHTKTMHWRLLNCSKHFHLPVKFLEELLVWIYSCHWFLRWNLKKTKGFSVPPTPLPERTKSILPKAAQQKVLGFNHKHGLLKAAEISSTLSLFYHSWIFLQQSLLQALRKHNFLIILQSFHNAF